MADNRITKSRMDESAGMQANIPAGRALPLGCGCIIHGRMKDAHANPSTAPDSAKDPRSGDSAGVLVFSPPAMEASSNQRGAGPNRKLVLLAALLVLCFICLLRWDTSLMSLRYRWLEKEPSGGFKQVLVGLRDFGQIVPITVAMIIVLRSDRRRVRIIAVALLAQLIGASVYNPLKWTIGRYRPLAVIEEVAIPEFAPGHQPDPQLSASQQETAEGRLYADWFTRLSPLRSWHVSAGPRSADHESFPSGHSGAAFALAAVLGWYYPRLRGLLWTLAVGCAASRVIDGAHWPSDCLVGAVIGYGAAWIAWKIIQRQSPPVGSTS